MKIVMMTNTYTPHVGGVARSVKTFTDYYRKKGHSVLVIAPEAEGADDSRDQVLRVPAIQKFNGSDFSVRLPIPFFVTDELNKFKPDIVHSHHPFLIGDTALRVAAAHNIPLIFTHHTMYEHYTHYVPGDSELIQFFAIELATGYANMCDQTIAPSESVAQVLVERGVETPIVSIPSGVNVKKYAKGNSKSFRKDFKIPHNMRLIGHVGRLAPEKNLEFLCQAVAHVLNKNKDSGFLLVGTGPYSDRAKELFKEHRLGKRLFLTSALTGQDLVNAYHAMELFVFTSKSETQGMVLAEAQAAGVPVIALDAPGAREIVKSGENGFLLKYENRGDFCRAIEKILKGDPQFRTKLKRHSKKVAADFSLSVCGDRTLAVYRRLIQSKRRKKEASRLSQDSLWLSALRTIEAEFKRLSNITRAADSAVADTIGIALQL